MQRQIWTREAMPKKNFPPKVGDGRFEVQDKLGEARGCVAMCRAHAFAVLRWHFLLQFHAISMCREAIYETIHLILYIYVWLLHMILWLHLNIHAWLIQYFMHQRIPVHSSEIDSPINIVVVRLCQGQEMWGIAALCQGCFGAVFLGKDKKSDSPVAVKFEVRAESSNDEPWWTYSGM